MPWAKLSQCHSVCLVEAVQCRDQQPTSCFVEQLGYTWDHFGLDIYRGEKVAWTEALHTFVMVFKTQGCKASICMQAVPTLQEYLHLCDGAISSTLDSERTWPPHAPSHWLWCHTHNTAHSVVSLSSCSHTIPHNCASECILTAPSCWYWNTDLTKYWFDVLNYSYTHAYSASKFASSTTWCKLLQSSHMVWCSGSWRCSVAASKPSPSTLDRTAFIADQQGQCTST